MIFLPSVINMNEKTKECVKLVLQFIVTFVSVLLGINC